MSTTHFGFKDVPTEEKAALVGGVFSRVAARYDVMNDAMSLGAHRLWKEALINALKPRPSMQLLDLAGGTGDIAFRALKRAPGMRVTLADINAQMLEEGRNRAIDRNILHGIDWVCADAETLPLADASVDACTIAFGLRNVTDTARALRDIHRVLKPGGHFLCLEFSPAQAEWLKGIYDAYSFRVIPALGKMLAGDAQPYQYLVESIRRFHRPQALVKLMEDAGFARVSWRPMSAGIVALHSGWKI